MPSVLTFTERIERRRALWWGAPTGPPWRRVVEVYHRRRERLHLRRPGDPDEAWRCCAYWPRTLVNKWNGRLFAQQHGARVPELYYHGRAPSAEVIAGLPEQIAIRPLGEHSGNGVVVLDGEFELMTCRPLVRPALAAVLPRNTDLLIEERILDEDGAAGLPVEYKLHVFGDKVGAVQVIQRIGGRAHHRFYTQKWEPIADPMYRSRQDELRFAPNCFDEMLAVATRIGPIVGTYLRVDFFASTRGAMFNEFSSVPKTNFTPYCDELFGRLWQEASGDAGT